ncbi:MAG: CRISPR system precrRNA processing endoribonuclease RAMP protein Cas6 [Bryobacteraceae bacterium]
MTLQFWRIAAHFPVEEPAPFGAGEAGNYWRGKLGMLLPEEWFRPKRVGGPSGLADPPRPFVLRIPDDQPLLVGVNVFSEEAVAPIAEALRQLGAQRLESEPVTLSLSPSETAEKLRVSLVTPTELKGGPQPAFHILFARVRDRVSTLRTLYGEGPLDIDFRAMGTRAKDIRLMRCELRHVLAQRTSSRTGQTHALNGFVGTMEYEGALTEFLPLLRAAEWTGVGRQTVWGKGQIRVEKLDESGF